MVLTLISFARMYHSFATYTYNTGSNRNLICVHHFHNKVEIYSHNFREYRNHVVIFVLAYIYCHLYIFGRLVRRPYKQDMNRFWVSYLFHIYNSDGSRRRTENFLYHGKLVCIRVVGVEHIGHLLR